MTIHATNVTPEVLQKVSQSASKPYKLPYVPPRCLNKLPRSGFDADLGDSNPQKPQKHYSLLRFLLCRLGPPYCSFG